MKTAPATPYKITVCILPQSAAYTSSYRDSAVWHLLARQRVRARLLTYGWGLQSYPLAFAYAQWTNHTTLSAGQYQYPAICQAPFWIRFSDDGTNRNVQISSDGFKFANVTAPQGRTVFLTADQVGVFANSWKSTGLTPRVISFLHWSQA